MVLTLEMEDLYIPAAVTAMLSFDSVVTYIPLPKAVDTAETASEAVTLLIVGTTVEGTVTVNDTLFVPIVVVPDLVVTVAFAVADVPLMALIHVAGIVTLYQMLQFDYNFQA